MPEYVQVGKGPKANQEEINAKLELFLSLLQAFDPEGPTIETLVAVAIVKKVCETKLGQEVDVQLQAESGGTIDEIKTRLQERYERTGSIKPLPTIPDPVDPSVH